MTASFPKDDKSRKTGFAALSNGRARVGRRLWRGRRALGADGEQGINDEVHGFPAPLRELPGGRGGRFGLGRIEGWRLGGGFAHGVGLGLWA
jgi:hypothetical protein